MLKSLWSTILDIVYPPKCPSCKAAVDAHGAWCDRCFAGVFSVREINVYQHNLKYLDSCLTVCDYAGGLKRVIHDIKFREANRYARSLQWLLDKGVDPQRLGGIDAVVPVPLHADRLKERGYNQTDLIFKTWSIQQGWQWHDDYLVRVRPTIPQWELKLSERRQNIKDAFNTNSHGEIAGKNILLVDDIITSGTTMNECAKVLKKAGAIKVTGLALASGAPY